MEATSAPIPLTSKVILQEPGRAPTHVLSRAHVPDGPYSTAGDELATSNAAAKANHLTIEAQFRQTEDSVDK